MAKMLLMRKYPEFARVIEHLSESMLNEYLL